MRAHARVAAEVFLREAQRRRGAHSRHSRRATSNEREQTKLIAASLKALAGAGHTLRRTTTPRSRCARRPWVCRARGRRPPQTVGFWMAAGSRLRTHLQCPTGRTVRRRRPIDRELKITRAHGFYLATACGRSIASKAQLADVCPWKAAAGWKPVRNSSTRRVPADALAVCRLARARTVDINRWTSARPSRSLAQSTALAAAAGS